MSSLQEYRYYYGVLLSQICFLFHVKKSDNKKVSKMLHKAFKEYAGIDSLTTLNTYQMEGYLGMVRMLMSRERGIFISEPKEDEGCADWDMHRFLQYKLYNKTI